MQCLPKSNTQSIPEIEAIFDKGVKQDPSFDPSLVNDNITSHLTPWNNTPISPSPSDNIHMHKSANMPVLQATASLHVGERQEGDSENRHASNGQYPSASPRCHHEWSCHSQERQGMTDFVRFFAGRELVSTGLLAFDDRPESYRACRSSFLNAIRGLDLSPSEEIDLLAKWLRSESSDHVKRIRAVNVNQPERGLRLVWNRLEECYGSPEVIDSVLFEDLMSSPKSPKRITPK